MVEYVRFGLTKLYTMLFKQATLKQIKAGKVKLAFRKWKTPSAKAGGLQKTSIGVLLIEEVKKIPSRSITNEWAVKAGYENKEALLQELNTRSEGAVYKIKLRLHGEDPRLELREQLLSAEECIALQKKLQQLERKTTWVNDTLKVIQQHPHTRAADLAGLLHREKDWLKLHIRKLKNLGLTISFEPGYTLSPRGVSYMKWLGKKTK